MWKIYKHTFPNGKIYIGQTKNSLSTRFQNGQGYKSCPLIQRAINKYGWNNVQTELLEDNIPSLELANEREQYYIKMYNSRNPDIGYNISPGGGAKDGVDYEVVYQEWIDHPELGVKAIATKLQCDRNTVAKILNLYGIDVANRMSRVAHSISQSNRQYDYASIYSAWKTNPNYSDLMKQFNCSEDTIRRALKENGVSEQERRIIGQIHLNNNPNGYNRKQVNQYDLNGNYIQTFSSIAQANLSLGKQPDASNIVTVCKGKRKTAYGYKWSYTNNE